MGCRRDQPILLKFLPPFVFAIVPTRNRHQSSHFRAVAPFSITEKVDRWAKGGIAVESYGVNDLISSTEEFPRKIDRPPQRNLFGTKPIGNQQILIAQPDVLERAEGAVEDVGGS